MKKSSKKHLYFARKMKIYSRRLPEVKVNSGFIEIGKYLYDEYELEDSVGLIVLRDGGVWAKIANSPLEIPIIE
jgi:hypothetical protein